MHNYFVLTGPTAAGKTAWLVSRARSQTMLAISADSRQAYRYMDIGTGKPSPSEQQILPHYGLDCVEPGINNSVYQFLTIAANALRFARQTNTQIWVCGGAGLYIRALVERLELGQPPRPLLRRMLQHKFIKYPSRHIAELHQVQVLDADNPVRVVRALELKCADPDARQAIYNWCGLTMEDAEGDQAGNASQLTLDDLRELTAWQCGGIAVLDPGRQPLAERIDRRVRGMFDAGLVDEVRQLRAAGYGAAAVVADGIGYREAGSVLDGTQSLEQAIAGTIVRTRQYAKRQRTYFRSQGWPVVAEEQLNTWAQLTARQSGPG